MKFTDAVAYIVDRLGIYAPRLDTSPVSRIRPLIDAVAELHAQASTAVEEVFEWDISKLSGRDLDDFVSVFGFTRVPATHATGYLTVTFAANATENYLIDQGTLAWAYRPGGKRVAYQVSTNTAIPRYSAFQTIPIVAQDPGSESNAQVNEVNFLDFNLGSVVMVRNDEPVSGGRGPETDEELRKRFRADLFRNVMGSEAYYRSIARRHPRVAGVQMIRPYMAVEEHLKIVNNRAECQEDSIVYTYPDSVTVYLPRLDDWLEETRDFIVTIDNNTPRPPVIDFVGNAHEEGETVRVRYGYCSNRSRNNPRTGTMHYLDMYVTGKEGLPVTDYAAFPPMNAFGTGSINFTTHPEGLSGKPYYVFARQPVATLPPEIEVHGRRYFINKDYALVRDRSTRFGSTRAKDCLLWLSTLPATGTVTPSFHIPYYVEGVVEEIQETLDSPDITAATDDVLVHGAEAIVFDVDLTIEWDRGITDVAGVRLALQEHFADVDMGSRIRIGPLMRAISEVPRVATVFLREIRSTTTIRGRNTWNFDVPLIDGTVPVLGALNIDITAPNVYEAQE